MEEYYYIVLIKPEAVQMQRYRDYINSLISAAGLVDIYGVRRILTKIQIDSLYAPEIEEHGENRRVGYHFQLTRGESEIIVTKGMNFSAGRESELYSMIIGDLEREGFRGKFIKPNRTLKFWKSLNIGLSKEPSIGSGYDRLFNGCHGSRNKDELIHNINWICQYGLLWPEIQKKLSHFASLYSKSFS